MSSQTISIHSQLNIINARALAREWARVKGFGLQNQARIALATSSVAHELGLGTLCQGQITLDCLDDHPRKIGIRITCVKMGGALDSFTNSAILRMRRLVDELNVETLPPSDLEITMIKWQKR